jgi:hypothetical protein
MREAEDAFPFGVILQVGVFVLVRRHDALCSRLQTRTVY